MNTYTPSQIAALKLALMTEHRVGTRGLSDAQIYELAIQHGLSTAPTAPTAPQTKKDDTMTTPAINSQQAALLAQLLATMQPQSAQVDEKRIIELINEHSPIKRIEVKALSGKRTQLDQVAHACFERSLNHLSLGKQLFFYGRSGAGKSTTAKLLAQALDTPIYIQGAIIAKFETLGSLTASGYNKSTIRKWLENPDGGLLCIDEIDGSCPRALVTIMSIFDPDGELSFPDGETFKRTEKHLLVVTANTTGAGASSSYVGRCRLDAATLNRFTRIEHDYDADIENSLADKRTVDYCRKFRDVVSKKGLDGSLVTPRTIISVGKTMTSDLPTADKMAMLMDDTKQGLTDSEFKAVIAVVGAY